MTASLPSAKQVAILKTALNHSEEKLREVKNLARPYPNDSPYIWRQYRAAKARVPALKAEVDRRMMDFLQAERELEIYLRDARENEHFHKQRTQD